MSQDGVMVVSLDAILEKLNEKEMLEAEEYGALVADGLKPVDQMIRESLRRDRGYAGLGEW